MDKDQLAEFLKMLGKYTKDETLTLGALMLAYPQAATLRQLDAIVHPSYNVNNPIQSIAVLVSRLRPKLPENMIIQPVGYGSYVLRYVNVGSSRSPVHPS